jgi:hypothetical protein
MSETGIVSLPRVVFDMTEAEINKCGPATHLPILCEVLSFLPSAEHVLEFGCGDYSTALFLQAKRKVISVETDLEWANKVATTQHVAIENGYLKIAHVHAPTGELGALTKMGYGPDGKFAHIAMVDGLYQTRAAIAQTLITMDMASVVVCHDTERKEYNWQTIVLPAGWLWVEVRDYAIWTSVACCPGQSGLAKRLQDAFRNVATYKELGLAEKGFKE